MLAERFYGSRPTGGPASLHGGVCASAMRQCCSRARARSDLIASGALSVAPQAGRALFSCSAHDINVFPTGPGVKSTNARDGEAQVYYSTSAGAALDSHFRPYLLQGRTSEAKNDCNKKSTR